MREQAPRYQVGQLVQVKSKDEILATLDERGELDNLPFMPEMLKYSDRQLRVYRRAIKTCDTVGASGMHRMDNAVLLEGARCDGAAHGGCDARCMIFWKEDWIRPVPMKPDSDARTDARVDTSGRLVQVSPQQRRLPAADGRPRCSEAHLERMTRASGDSRNETSPTYRCQATELPRAAPVRLPWWDARQYVRDVRAGNATLSGMLHSIAIMLFNKFQSFDRKFLPGEGLIRGAQHWPFLNGNLTKTPKRRLDLQPGDIVRVKSQEAIVATLDKNRRNRGLSFDAEMVKYCGHEFRVLSRPERIIEEQTGKMLNLPNDCIILEGAICAGEHYQFCPRSIYPFWREAWLEVVRRADANVTA